MSQTRMQNHANRAVDPVARLLSRQDLVLSRAQALAAGMPPETLRHRIRNGGPWQRLMPGVYLAATGTPTASQLEVAAVLYAGRESAITGVAALRRHRMNVPAAGTVTVLVPARNARQSRSFVTVWPTTRMPDRVCFEGPVQFTLPERAVADAARECASFRGVRALVARAVQQNLCRIDLLRQELAAGPVRQSAWLRRALSEVAGGIRSGAEGDFRDLITSAGLPMPMFNPQLYLGDKFVAMPDAWWPEAGVAGEVDSREWHLSPEDWERTLRRHDLMSACGIIVLHFTPSQVRREPADVLASIQAALAVGRRRPPLPLHAVPAPE